MQGMEALPSNYQAATLVALPSYPNSIAWSDDNLVAIPSENLITILNPASLTSARAFITLQQNKPFRIGLVERKDLLTPCLQPISLLRDTRPYARSISWSPSGLAPNSGSFLAVCTTDGHVKIYQAPYCEYKSEWIEVMDISHLLFDHLTNSNYREEHDQSLGICGAKCSNISNRQLRSNDKLIVSVCSMTTRSRKRKGTNGRYADFVEEATLYRSNVNKTNSGTYYSKDGVLLEDNEANPENGIMNSIDQSSNLPHINAEEYASRSAILSSLVVAWSPMLQSSETCFSILSVGVRSGAIFFWRISEPQHFSIKHSYIPVNAKLIGFIQAHNSWITAICFGFSAANYPESQLVLATGSSDGSVKIWSGNVEGFLMSEDTKSDCFSFLTEVTNATFIPISTIAMTIPTKSSELVLALGSGAGKLEVWIYDTSCKKLHFAGDYNAHEQVVTGLAWAFDGRCLYSCSQDNSIRSWNFNGNSLHKAPFSSTIPASYASSDISRVSDLCFGLALSPGGLMLALVRSLDANLQHQMYEKRSQKAVVEFFWTGGQPLEVSPDKNIDDCKFDSVNSMCEPELAFWETNILQFLMNFENVNKPIVIWDTITSLITFRKDFSGIVKKILTKWISSWFSDPSIDSPEKILILFHDRDNLLAVSSRKFQLLNIVCRRVMLCEMEFDLDEDDQLKPGKLNSRERNPDSWNELLVISERELRERLVAFSFQTVLNCAADFRVDHGNHTNWLPVGVVQMEQWTAINYQSIHSQLKVLGLKVAEIRRNNNGLSEFVEEEICPFCSALVPFESPEVAQCKGIPNQKGSIERHKLTRCTSSMRLCSVIEPMWFCMCCRRLAASLLSRSFFTMSNSPLDFRTKIASTAIRGRPKPLCPFCGIQLQRSMPDFLLSTSPV